MCVGSGKKDGGFIVSSSSGCGTQDLVTLQEPQAEQLIQQLYSGLSAAQRAEICFSFEHIDERLGPLSRFIANHWQVTRPCIRSRFFTPEQQVIIHGIFRSLLSPAWYPLFMRQLHDDTKGHPWGQDQSIAILGNPKAGPYQFLFTGRHLTLRADGGSVPGVAFGGPIVYGHAAAGRYHEAPLHPGNIFWPQAVMASRLFDMLHASQRDLAVVDRLPGEVEINFREQRQGVPVASFGPDQHDALRMLLQVLLAPFRAEDQQRILRCLKRQGGVDCLAIAFSRAHRPSAPFWDIWRIEGPAFIWHFEGMPHVHGWINIADKPGVTWNARHGLFVFPEHDPLQ